MSFINCCINGWLFVSIINGKYFDRNTFALLVLYTFLLITAVSVSNEASNIFCPYPSISKRTCWASFGIEYINQQPAVAK